MAFHRRLGYVPEEPNLYTFLSASEYLELVGRLRELPPRLLARKIKSLLELFGLLHAAIGRLPPLQRTLLTLYHLEDMPIGEISRVTGLADGTIKSHLSRGRDLLREQIEREVGTGELLTSIVGELERWIGDLSALAKDETPA